MEHISNQILFQMFRNQELPFQFEQGLLIFFGLKGECHVLCGNTDYEIQPAGLLVVNPFELYRLSCPPNGAMICLKISRALLRMVEWQDTRRCSCYERSNVKEQMEYQQLRKLYAGVFRDFFQNDGAAPAAIVSSVIQMTGILQSKFSSNVRTNTQQEHSMQRLKRILDYIHENWNESISLSSIAASEYLSVSYLSRFFQKHLHISFSQYVMDLRLRYAARMLMQGTQSVTRISYDCGFHTPSAFIEAFKQKYTQTPGQFRQDYRVHQLHSFTDDSEGEEQNMQVLMDYLPDVQPKELAIMVRPIHVDVSSGGELLRQRSILNIGYAREGLLAPVQEQIRRAQNEIGFDFIRFHGLLDSDMHIYQEDAQGNAFYDFTYVDLLFDFVLAVGLKPFVEFSFMPSLLAREQTMIFDRPTVISGCRDAAKWKALISATVQHFTRRYGRNTVRQWRFSTITQSYVHLNCISWEDYTVLYSSAHHAVKGEDSAYIFAGPGWFSDLLESEHGISDFLEFARENNCVPDCWTMQCNPHILASGDSLFMDFTLSQQSAPAIISKDADVVAHAVERMEHIFSQEGLHQQEIIIVECCSTLWQRDLSGDTCYKSAWLAKNICENYGRTVFGYWLLTDMIEERASIQSVFHGGYGLITCNGIPKAGYRAMQLLHCLDGQRIASGEGWMLTRNGRIYQLMTYNYSHYSNLYRYRYKRLAQPMDAYSVFEAGMIHRMQFHFDCVPDGLYRIERRAVTREFGSSFDRWLQLGAPAYPSEDEKQWLIDTSVSQYQVETVRAENGLRTDVLLQPLEIQLLTFYSVD